jgi:hypothetical protein
MLFAVVDAAFAADGSSVVVGRALVDAESRAIPLERLQLRRSRYNIHIGLVAHGPKRRFDLIVTNPSQKNKTLEKEQWLYVRHFRLGGSAKAAFDNTWRYYAIRVSKFNQRSEGQMFVDAHTIPADPDFVQCLPFLPLGFMNVSMVNDAEGKVDALDASVVDHRGGAALLWGYQLRVVFDELALFNTSLSHGAIAEVGEDSFAKEVSISRRVLWTLVAISVAACVLAALVFVMRHRSLDETVVMDVGAVNGEEAFPAALKLQPTAVEAPEDVQEPAVPHRPLHHRLERGDDPPCGEVMVDLEISEGTTANVGEVSFSISSTAPVRAVDLLDLEDEAEPDNTPDFAPPTEKSSEDYSEVEAWSAGELLLSIAALLDPTLSRQTAESLANRAGSLLRDCEADRPPRPAAAAPLAGRWSASSAASTSCRWHGIGSSAS